MSINNEENIKELLQAIYKPVSASPEFKEALLKSLADKVSGKAKEPANPLRVRPALWFAAAGAIVLVAISYGILLPVTAIASLPALPP